MKKCMLCGQMTSGSVGAAGIRWSIICQPCKDREDDLLMARVKAEAKALDKLVEAIAKEANNG